MAGQRRAQPSSPDAQLAQLLTRMFDDRKALEQLVTEVYAPMFEQVGYVITKAIEASALPGRGRGPYKSRGAAINVEETGEKILAVLKAHAGALSGPQIGDQIGVRKSPLVRGLQALLAHKKITRHLASGTKRPYLYELRK